MVDAYAWNNIAAANGHASAKKNKPFLAKSQIDQLQKALPNCKIGSNPKK